MARFGGEMASCLMVLIMIFSAIRTVPAAVYTVGELSGWSMGGNYGSWANGKTFAVGDTLVFNYPPGHTVDEVSETDYKTCTTGNSISTDSTGGTPVTLTTTGPHYFICGIPGHCTAGMKLSVTVGGATLATPAVTATSPPSSTIPSLTQPPAFPEPPSAAVTPGGVLTRPLFSATSPSLSPLAAVATSGDSTVTEISSSAMLSPSVAMFLTLCIVIFLSFFQ